MPDLQLTMQPVPRLAPRPDALDQVRDRAGEIRRHRIRTTVAVVGVASTLVAAYWWPSTAEWHSLQPAHRLPPSASPSPAGAPVRPKPGGLVDPRPARATVAPSTTSLPAVGPAAPEPTLAPFDDDWSFGSEALQVVAFEPDVVVPPEGMVCSEEASGATLGPDGWCIRLVASPPSGVPYQWLFSAIVCRPLGSGEGTIEVDQLPRLRIYDPNEGVPVFDSVEHPWDHAGDAQPGHSWHVLERGCLMLSSPWKSIDNDGNLVDDGTYRWDWDPIDRDFDAWAADHDGGTIDVRPSGE